MSAIRGPAETERLLGCYLSIERASLDMVEAARDGDWDRVCDVQERCELLIEQARRLAATVPLSQDGQRAKLRIVRRIVVNEAQVRRLSHPWTERVERIVAGAPAAGHGAAWR